MPRTSTLGLIGLASVALMACTAHRAVAETKGYVISWFQPAYYAGDDDCPNGVSQELDWKQIFTKEGKTPAEIQALFEHPQSPEFIKAMMHRGPHGEDVCVDPASVLDPSWKTVQGKHSHGLNLDGTQDGAATANTCKHDKFVGVDGEPSVDNQLYRAMGCAKIDRGTKEKDGHDAFHFAYMNERMREGLFTYLIEITGNKDLRNSDNVEVGIYQGIDPVLQDGSGGVRADTTLRISADKRWHNKVHATIKDGVLTSDVFDLNLSNDPMVIPEYHFKRARLRLEMQADGSLKGHLSGYQDWNQMFWSTAKGGWLLEKFSSGNCPGQYYALQHMADGDPDPKTGQCTTISSDYGLEAVPAFLIHPQETKVSKTAEAGDAVRTAASH